MRTFSSVAHAILTPREAPWGVLWRTLGFLTLAAAVAVSVANAVMVVGRNEPPRPPDAIELTPSGPDLRLPQAIGAAEPARPAVVVPRPALLDAASAPDEASPPPVPESPAPLSDPAAPPPTPAAPPPAPTSEDVGERDEEADAVDPDLEIEEPGQASERPDGASVNLDGDEGEAGDEPDAG